MEEFPQSAERIRPVTDRLLRPPKLRDLGAEQRQRDFRELLCLLFVYALGVLVLGAITKLITDYAFPQ